MSVEGVLYEYNEFEDLMGVVRELQVAGVSDEEQERLLRQWVARMGEDYEDWMTTVVTGPPVSGDVPGEVEVLVG